MNHNFHIFSISRLEARIKLLLYIVVDGPIFCDRELGIYFEESYHGPAINNYNVDPHRNCCNWEPHFKKLQH